MVTCGWPTFLSSPWRITHLQLIWLIRWASFVKDTGSPLWDRSINSGPFVRLWVLKLYLIPQSNSCLFSFLLRSLHLPYRRIAFYAYSTISLCFLPFWAKCSLTKFSNIVSTGPPVSRRHDSVTSWYFTLTLTLNEQEASKLNLELFGSRQPRVQVFLFYKKGTEVGELGRTWAWGHPLAMCPYPDT